MNAKLRRQALILSLLPDMVIAINVDGVITFCSAQVERLLQHSSDDLIGAKLVEILLPPSRTVLRRLVEKLVTSKVETKALRGDNVNGNEENVAANHEENNEGDGGTKGAHPDRTLQGNARGENDVGVVVVSDLSFPLSVVNVKNRSKEAAANVEDVSDSSGGENAASAAAAAAADSTNDKGNSNDSKGGTSSLTSNTSLSRSTTNLSFANDAKDASSDNRSGAAKSEQESVSTDRAVKSDHRHGSSSGRKDSSTRNRSGNDSFSLSNFRKASEALNRNVRWHNEKMMASGIGEAPQDPGLTDDVTGASVTANNAGARLSSLQHLPSMNIEASNNTIGIGNKADPSGEEGDATKKLARKVKTSPVNRTSSTLTFESLEDVQSSSSDSLLSGAEETGGREKRGSSRSASSRRNGELSSDDSGYRESGESVPSREDTSSSASYDASTDEKDASRPKPVAPTCDICVIRKDLSTIWCEVSSSIRTRTLDDDGGAEGIVSAGTKMSVSENSNGIDQAKSSSDVHELLLCFRPIRDGKEGVREELRFVPPKKLAADDGEEQEQASADRSNTGSRSTEGVSSLTQSADQSNNTEDATNTSGSSADKLEAFTRSQSKKRVLPPQEGITVSASSNSSAPAASTTTTATSGVDGSLEEPAQKRRKSLRSEDTTSQSEADVAESLVLMNRTPQ